MSEDLPRGSSSVPPIHTRFVKGQTGNPLGRPKKRIAYLPYEAALGQPVILTDEHGNKRTVTAEEAFLITHVRLGKKGETYSSKKILALSERIAKYAQPDPALNNEYVSVNDFMGSVNDVALPLGMAHKRDRSGLAPCIVLETWLVQAALDRLEDRVFTAEEQREIWGATRTPNKVNWPDWWTERRGTGRKMPKPPLIDADGFMPPCVVPQRPSRK